METDALPSGCARLPEEPVVLNTLQILPRIFGVHIIDDEIPL
jgi:hypothetical protein